MMVMTMAMTKMAVKMAMVMMKTGHIYATMCDEEMEVEGLARSRGCRRIIRLKKRQVKKLSAPSTRFLTSKVAKLRSLLCELMFSLGPLDA